MKVGILGRVGSGRGTIFDALTAGQGAPRSAGKTRLGIARVIDPRVDRLTGLCQPKKTVHAEATIAVPANAGSGPVEIAPVREMRDLVAYAHVVGVFGGDDLAADAARQISELTTELVLADMERVENRRARIAKGGGARPGEEEALARATAQLEAEQPLRLLAWEEPVLALLGELGLMSQRPLLTVLNVPEARAGEAPPAAVLAAARGVGAELLWLCATLEAEISALEPASQAEFLSAYGLAEPVAGRFVRACLELLDQICFFTVGPDEVRAWNIRRGTTARRAARTIHTDLEKGFIRAEVIDYDVFVAHGSEAKVKAAGKLRLEGKDYVVRDGDIITVRFNV
jgi:ribosome-binding ATPase YchF (GTP1/OBG family)